MNIRKYAVKILHYRFRGEEILTSPTKSEVGKLICKRCGKAH